MRLRVIFADSSLQVLAYDSLQDFDEFFKRFRLRWCFMRGDTTCRGLDDFHDFFWSARVRKGKLDSLRLRANDDVRTGKEHIEQPPLDDVYASDVFVADVLSAFSKKAPIKIDDTVACDDPNIIVPVEDPIHEKQIHDSEIQ